MKKDKKSTYFRVDIECFNTNMTAMEIHVYSYIRNWNLSQNKPVNNYSSEIAEEFKRNTRQIDKLLNQLYKKGWLISYFIGQNRQLVAIDLLTKKPIIKK